MRPLITSPLRFGVEWMSRRRVDTRFTLLAGWLVLVLAAQAWWLHDGARAASWSAAALLFSGTGLGFFALCFRQSHLRATRDLQRLIDAVAAGDLTQASQVSGSDELGHVASGIDGMARRLSRVVAGVRSDAQLVAMASDRLSDHSSGMSDRTEQQASSLQQTAASICELSGSVRHNADEVRAADQCAAEVCNVAQGTASAVDSAVESMLGMERRSAQMTDIIATIDGIAFQTNILALNAAVEAARAGESGRGFAVVATEVRMLAQRSAQAASEVKKLIEGSTEETRRGVTLIREASRSLAGVVSGIREVAERLAQVSSTSAQQSTGLQEIDQAVRSLDDLTQRNAQMVENTVHAAQTLRTQAQRLSSGVIHIRLRQGCADEARAMVERAVALIKAQGRSAAVSRFHDRQHGGFVDRDMFIIVIDRQGYFRAFGVDPSKADKPAVAAPGVDVQALNMKTWATADQGGGWIEFTSLHPATKLPVEKMAYVLGADADWTVMCSINRDDGSGTAAAPSAQRTAT